MGDGIVGLGKGGGHSWFGSIGSFWKGLSKQKSMFPISWSKEKIMHAVSHVTINNQWVQQTGRVGATMTKSGQPVRYVIEGVYENIKIKVVATAEDIITAHPIK